MEVKAKKEGYAQEEPTRLRTPVPQENIPFAVVGSCEVVRDGARPVRGRRYSWGTVEGKARHALRAAGSSVCIHT